MDSLTVFITSIPDVETSFFEALGKLSAVKKWLTDVENRIKNKKAHFGLELFVGDDDSELLAYNDEIREMILLDVAGTATEDLLKKLDTRYRKLVDSIIEDFGKIIQNGSAIIGMRYPVGTELYDDPLKFYKKLVQAEADQLAAAKAQLEKSANEKAK